MLSHWGSDMGVDELLDSGMRAIVRERNSNFYYCKELLSDMMCGYVGELITQYCYGVDCVIPDGIVDILNGNREFKTHDNSIKYRYEFGDSGRWDGTCLVLNVGTEDERDYYPNDEEWTFF